MNQLIYGPNDLPVHKRTDLTIRLSISNDVRSMRTSRDTDRAVHRSQRLDSFSLCFLIVKRRKSQTIRTDVSEKNHRNARRWIRSHRASRWMAARQSSRGRTPRRPLHPDNLSIVGMAVYFVAARVFQIYTRRPRVPRRRDGRERETRGSRGVLLARLLGPKIPRKSSTINPVCVSSDAARISSGISV